MSSPVSQDGSVISTRRPAQGEGSVRTHPSGGRPRAQSSDLSPREEAPTPTSVTGRPSGMPPSGNSMNKPSAAPRLSTGSHGRSRSFAGTTANTASQASPRPPRSLQASTSDHNRITVACRVRPRSNPRRGAGCVSVDADGRTVSWSEGNADTANARRFTFDYAAGPGVGQEELFEQVGRPVTNACLDGYNGTIFCYGQTGSGKTFTTFGPPTKPRVEAYVSGASSGYIGLDAPLGDDRGLVPRVLEYLFDRFSKAGQGSPEKSGADSGPAEMHSCRCSFFEIYNEHVFDLAAGDGAGSGSKERASLSVREAADKGAFVEGLREEEVKSAGEAVEVLRRGYASRHTASTAMNAASSRSHAIFTMVIDTVLPASVAPECERDSPSVVGTSDPSAPRDRYSCAHALLDDPQLEAEATTPRNSTAPSGAIRKRSARFNLVDLAGSERQSKAHTRGAQLKDAASINKSLSALGRVINSLVEGAGAGHVREQK